MPRCREGVLSIPQNSALLIDEPFAGDGMDSDRGRIGKVGVAKLRRCIGGDNLAGSQRAPESPCEFNLFRTFGSVRARMAHIPAKSAGDFCDHWNSCCDGPMRAKIRRRCRYKAGGVCPGHSVLKQPGNRVAAVFIVKNRRAQVNLPHGVRWKGLPAVEVDDFHVPDRPQTYKRQAVNVQVGAARKPGQKSRSHVNGKLILTTGVPASIQYLAGSGLNADAASTRAYPIAPKASRP